VIADTPLCNKRPMTLIVDMMLQDCIPGRYSICCAVKLSFRYLSQCLPTERITKTLALQCRRSLLGLVWTRTLKSTDPQIESIWLRIVVACGGSTSPHRLQCNYHGLVAGKSGQPTGQGCAQSRADRQNPARSVVYVEEDKAVELVKCMRAFNVTGSGRLIYL